MWQWKPLQHSVLTNKHVTKFPYFTSCSFFTVWICALFTMPYSNLINVTFFQDFLFSLAIRHCPLWSECFIRFSSPFRWRKMSPYPFWFLESYTSADGKKSNSITAAIPPSLWISTFKPMGVKISRTKQVGRFRRLWKYIFSVFLFSCYLATVEGQYIKRRTRPQNLVLV